MSSQTSFSNFAPNPRKQPKSQEWSYPVQAYVDAACSDQDRHCPRNAGYAIFVRCGPAILHCDVGRLATNQEDMTHHKATCLALERLSEWLGEECPGAKVQIYLDDQTVKEQMEGMANLKQREKRDIRRKIEVNLLACDEVEYEVKKDGVMEIINEKASAET